MLSKKILRIELIEWLLLLMILIYSTAFSYYTIMRHYSFRSNAWDLGILAQSIATTIKGKLFVNNVELYYSPNGSYFGIHFSPILFLLIPFFYIIPKVETILIIQSIILALGSVPVYLLSKRTLKHNLTSLFITASYLLNPSLHGINWYDFHTQAFFPLFILLATYYLKERKLLLYSSFILMSLATIEQSLYFIVIYIIYCLWELRKEIKQSYVEKKVKKNILFPLFTIIIIGIWFITTNYAKQMLNPAPPPEIKAAKGFKFFDVNDPFEIPFKILTNPSLIYKAIQFDLAKKIFYIILTFAPSCFLAFISPVALLPSLLWLFLASLSNWPPYYQLGFQYAAFTLPFVTISTIESLKNIVGSSKDSSDKIMLKFSTLLFIVGIILSMLISPLSPIYKKGDYSYFRDYGISTPSFKDYTVLNIIKELPEEAKILTTSVIFPHLSTYPNAYTIPSINHPSPRLFESNLKYLKNNVDFDFILITHFWNKESTELIYDKFIKSNSKYGIFIKGPGFELYKKEYNENPINLSIKFNYNDLFIGDSSTIVDDFSSESGKSICFIASAKPGKIAWYGPYITLLPGNYTVKFKIKVDNVEDEKIIKLEVFSKYLGEIKKLEIYVDQISRSLEWNIFTLSFNTSERLMDVEFRGIVIGSNANIWLDYIEVIPN